MRKTTRVQGFTLVELLTVLAVMGLMVSLAIPALQSLGKATSLAAAGNQITNLINLARENSMSKNAMTAFVVITDPSLATSHREVVLLELDPRQDGSIPQSSDWKQTTSWQTLAPSVIIEFPNPAYPFQDSGDGVAVSGVPSPLLPALQPPASPSEASGTAGLYKYVVFLPNGTLLSGNSAQLRLSEGFYPLGSTVPVYTRPIAGSSPASPANYYAPTILSATGRVKTDFP